MILDVFHWPESIALILSNAELCFFPDKRRGALLSVMELEF